MRSSRSRGNQVAPGTIVIGDAFALRYPFHVTLLSCTCNRVFHALGTRNVIDKFVFHFFSDLCAASHSSQVFFGSLYHERRKKARKIRSFWDKIEFYIKSPYLPLGMNQAFGRSVCRVARLALLTVMIKVMT